MDKNRQEFVDLSLNGRATFDSPERAEAVLRLIVDDAPLMPTRCGVYEPFRTPFSSTELQPALNMLLNEQKQRLTPDRPSGDVWLERSRKPKCTYRIAWSRGPYTPFGGTFCYLDRDYIRDQTNLTRLLDHWMRLADQVDAWYGRIYFEEEFARKVCVRWQALSSRDSAESLERSAIVAGKLHRAGIPGIFWGNYLGSFYVDWLGRSKFDDLPCVEKRFLPNGSVFFTIAPTPFEWDTPAAREMELAVKEHLGADAFTDVESTQRQLDGLAQPLPHDFYPDHLVPRARLPEFPFAAELVEPAGKTVEEEVASAQRYFSAYGFKLLSVEGKTLTFEDRTGGMTRVTVGPGGKVEHTPNL